MSKPKITDFALTSRDLHKYRINLKEGIIDAIDADDHTRMMDAIERVGMFKEAMTVRPGSSKRSRLCSRRPSKEARKQHIEQVHRLQDFSRTSCADHYQRESLPLNQSHKKSKLQNHLPQADGGIYFANASNYDF
ncbi:hypothetical protein C7S15_3584 [Burkholderia cepacia]|uniref:hypothetical protein n=1 Tax=Burkholderia cepacia TaxID=292 RepID=UPI00298F415D|nr:hypothetical protein [Burkholderia cepacia]MDW9228984.1 hypothetical protein [Burkholderia cepacia]